MFRFVRTWPLNARAEAFPRGTGGDHANGHGGDSVRARGAPSPGEHFSSNNMHGSSKIQRLPRSRV